MSSNHSWRSIAFFFVVAGLAAGSVPANAQTAGVATNQTTRTSFKFSFGSGKAPTGCIQVLPTTVYTKELGYGFEPGANVTALDRGGNDAQRSGFITSVNHSTFPSHCRRGITESRSRWETRRENLTRRSRRSYGG